jgi:serine/threonine protein kinase
MRIWAHLRHENVVRLLGYTEEREGPALVSMLYLHGDVSSFLVKNPSVNREIIVRFH